MRIFKDDPHLARVIAIASVLFMVWMWWMILHQDEYVEYSRTRGITIDCCTCRDISWPW